MDRKNEGGKNGRMKLQLSGNVNVYYVQTLCMVFFPGSHFSDADTAEDEPSLKLDMTESGEGVTVRVTVSYLGKTAEKLSFRAKTDEPVDKTRKIAVGEAVVGACGHLLSYRPSWGMLTGVRPSKVATELLNEGLSKTRVKKILTSDYLVIPKKATLATDVALAEKKIIGVPDVRDCSVYISIPFCPSRCSYCSFVAYTSPKLLDLIPAYVDRLVVDVKRTFDLIHEFGLRVRSIYIGGGTPTVLNEEQLIRLLTEINRNCDVSAVEEFTLEAGRPDTITPEKLRIASSLGVSRISVNPQTLSDSVLREVGRRHTVDEFLRAYEIARSSKIPCINTDLIAGLPSDNFETFSASFDKILALDPENITVHTFCVKRAAEIRQKNRQVYSLRGGDAGKCVDYSQMQSAQCQYVGSAAPAEGLHRAMVKEAALPCKQGFQQRGGPWVCKARAVYEGVQPFKPAQRRCGNVCRGVSADSAVEPAHCPKQDVQCRQRCVCRPFPATEGEH